MGVLMSMTTQGGEKRTAFLWNDEEVEVSPFLK